MTKQLNQDIVRTNAAAGRKFWGACFCFSLIFFAPLYSLQAQGASAGKNTFAQHDIFQTSVFLENRNFIDDYKGQPVLYYAAHDQINAYFTENGVLYKLTQKADDRDNEEKERAKDAGRGKNEGSDGEEDAKEAALSIRRVQQQWLGANPHPQVIKGEKNNGHYTYLAKAGKTYRSIQTEGYKTITYKDVYAGIDVVYNFPEKGGMEYNLIVHPGADISEVKMTYTGDVENIMIDEKGNLKVHTDAGDVLEHAPVSYLENIKIKSAFKLDAGIIKFDLSLAYDRSKLLVVDPWIQVIANMSPENTGFDVDYDYAGNTFVYGAGPVAFSTFTGIVDSGFYNISKYDSNGVFQWTFLGSVPSIGWNTADTGLNYVGNAKVDKVSGKIYMTQGFNSIHGAAIVRLDVNGNYDNFVTAQTEQFTEYWGLNYKCDSGVFVIAGGGITSHLDLGIIDTSTGAVDTFNITGLTPGFQDFVCAAFDPSGGYYAILVDHNPILPYTNTLYKINAAYNGHLWDANTNYTVFTEGANMPFYENGGVGSGNWFNCLDANNNYLFYYDGFNLGAYNLANGAQEAEGNTNYAKLAQGGIAVDYCNNVYVGGIGVIRTYSLIGANFVREADISLGPGFENDTIFDVRYNPGRNLLYATGTRIVGIYAPTLPCVYLTPDNNLAGSDTCNSATVTVTSPVVAPFSYTWTNDRGHLVRRATNSTSITDTATGLTNGTYYINVQWQSGCNTISLFDSVTISCNQDTLALSGDTVICPGRAANLSSVASSPGGVYSWSPGGGSGSSITVTPDTTTLYTVTYTPLTGPVLTGTILVTLETSPTLTVNSPAYCPGTGAVITATPSVPGGTYLWSPGGATSRSITVSPDSTSTYTVTYSSSCGTVSAISTVTVNPTPAVTVTSDTVCAGHVATLTANPSGPGGTYLWTPGEYFLSSITVSPDTTTTYMVIYTSPHCGAVSGSGTVTVRPALTVTVNNPTICSGQDTVITAVTSVPGGTYTWAGELDSISSSITVAPTRTSAYIVTYTVAECGSQNATATVFVNSIPAVTVNSTAICPGGTAVLTARPNPRGGTYSWSPGGATTVSITVSPDTTTTYTVTYSGVPCGTASATATVIVDSTPSVSVTNDTVCPGHMAVIAATPSVTGGTYLWSPGGWTTASVDVSPDSTTDYTVTYKVSGCINATAIDTVTVSLSSGLHITLDTSGTFCGLANGVIQVNASNGTVPYRYSLNAGTYQPADSFTNLAAGNYSVSVYDTDGCNAAASAVLSASTGVSLVTAGVLITSPACGLSNGSVTGLSETNGTSPYTTAWTNSSNDTVSTTNNLTNVPAGTYTFTVVDHNGCTADTSFSLYTTGGLVLVTSGVQITPASCSQDNGSITGLSESGGNSPYTEIWTNSSHDTVSSSNNLTNVPSGTYTFSVYDESGCMADTSFNLSSTSGLVLVTSALVVTPTSCGLDNGSVTGISVNGGSSPYTYTWDTSGVLFSSSAAITNLPSGTYVLNITDINHCSIDTSIIITGSSGATPPSINANPDTICASDSAYICIKPATYASYNWNNGDTGACIYTSDAGNYYATVTDVHNCTAVSGRVEIAVNPTPDVSISIAGDTFTAYESTVVNWYLNGSAITGATGQVYVASQAGNYSVVVKGSDGCTAVSNIFYFANGINEIEPDAVNVYPNPLSIGSWQLDVSAGFIGQEIEIVDDNGRLVYSSQIHSVHSQIPANFARGVYFMKISSSNAAVVRKIVKL